MALDKLVDSSQLDADLLSVANAIRTKGGTSASLAFPAEFVSAIADIPTGGGGGEPEIELLDTITITTPVSSIAWTIPSSMSKFSELWIIGNITFSVADWLYVAIDTTTTRESNYTAKDSTVTFSCRLITTAKATVDGHTIDGASAASGFAGANRLRSIGTTYLSQLNIFPYTSSTNITSGAINIYGRGW